MGTATIHRRHSPFRRSLFIRDSCSSFLLEPLITRFSAFGTRKLRVYPLNSSTTTDIPSRRVPPIPRDSLEKGNGKRKRATRLPVIVRKMERARQRNGGNVGLTARGWWSSECIFNSTHLSRNQFKSWLSASVPIWRREQLCPCRRGSPAVLLSPFLVSCRVRIASVPRP